MTVPVQVPQNSYTADGINDTFAFTFRLLDNADLKVTVSGVLQIETVDYTIQNLTSVGGDVVFEAGSIPIVDAVVQLSRDTSRDQLTAYNPFDPFPAETHELALDKLTMIAQEVEAGAGGDFDTELDRVINGEWQFTDVIIGTTSGNVVSTQLTGFTLRTAAEVISSPWVFNNGITLNGSTWPSNLGSNGQVLASDGVGQTFWTTVTGGGGFNPSDNQTITGSWSFQTELQIDQGARLGNDRKLRGEFDGGGEYDIITNTFGTTGNFVIGDIGVTEQITYVVSSTGSHVTQVGSNQVTQAVARNFGSLLIRTPDNVDRKVGYRNPGNRTFSVSGVLTQNDEGSKVTTSTGGLNLTIPTLDADTIIQVKNVSLGDLNLIEDAGITLRHLDGGTVGLGDRILATFSVVTLEWVDATNVDVYGNGLT